MDNSNDDRVTSGGAVVPAEGSHEHAKRRHLLRERLQAIYTLGAELRGAQAAEEIERIVDELLRLPEPAAPGGATAAEVQVALSGAAELRKLVNGQWLPEVAHTEATVQLDRIEAALTGAEQG